MSLRNTATSVTRNDIYGDAHTLPAWYVVQTKPRQEFRALEQLQNQQYECYLPTLQTKKVHRGKLITATEPLFSRYLFIHLDSVITDWSPIRSTRGVTGIVNFSGRYTPLPDAYVESLQEMAQQSPADLFKPGEQVTIVDGPFAGLGGLYQLPDGEARAFVLIELMRQPQKLSFSMKTLRKAN
ncbi:MAG TPA: transcription/translation regulatory transformer protein RfaH [Noviherbaspirillum sp.]